MTGLECTECKPGYHNLQSQNPLGCDSCACNRNGVIGGLLVCEEGTGQCPCKFYASGVKCAECRKGFYGLHIRQFMGCTGKIRILCDVCILPKPYLIL